ncbi:hypothetical protein [Streptomyces sp. NPDC058426]|uniref:hypothetical protein n=1 Tax=Streptomyces sp. NPDC058426 TaxID=3346493 RepID=UPI00366630CB
MTIATLTEGAYEGFTLEIGGVRVEVQPVAGRTLAEPDVEILVDVFMPASDGVQRCALTERVHGAQQLRDALVQWRAILS